MARGRRRARWVHLWAAACICLVAGCSAAATNDSGTAGSPAPLPSGVVCRGATCHYADVILSFDYPAEWEAAHFDVVSSFSNDLVYLSTSPLSDPCNRAANGMDCVRLAARSLGPGGLLVAWRARGFPNWTFDPNKGAGLTIGARPATLEEWPATPDCQTIGGTRELQATIPRSAEANWMEMDACLAGPDAGPATTQIETMLATVRWND